MFSTAGEKCLLTFAVLLCAALGPNLCLITIVCDSWYKERNLKLDLPWQNGGRSHGTYLEQ